MVWVYSFVVTAIILKVLDLTMGLRVSEEEELIGLDVSQHGERAYVIEETAGGLAAIPPVASEPQRSASTQKSTAPGSSGGGA